MQAKTVYFFLTLILFSACSKTPELFPKEMSRMKLTKILRGEEAKQFVNKLHINQVTNEKNEIGFFEASNATAMIYVTHYPNELDAYNNFEKMTKKISPQNSVFVRSSFFELNGKTIYKTFGMGQTHFVFTEAKMLFWISTETTLSKEFLENYLKQLD